jgi:hypothetical protein
VTGRIEQRYDFVVLGAVGLPKVLDARVFAIGGLGGLDALHPDVLHRKNEHVMPRSWELFFECFHRFREASLAASVDA